MSSDGLIMLRQALRTRLAGTELAWPTSLRFLACLGVVLALAGCAAPEPPEVGTSCDSLADCRGDNNLVCQDQRCNVVSCETPGDCPGETTCIDGLCVPRQCDAPGSCEEGSRCWEGLCIVGGCANKTGCQQGQVCLGTPSVCTEPPPRCSDDRECASGEGCNIQRRECAPNCGADEDCSGGSYCLEGICHQPCRDSIDCPGERSCIEGRCQQLPDCSEHRECSGLRLYRDPLTCECVSCLQSNNCDLSAQEICTSSGQCVFCPQTATSEDDCTARGQVYVEGCCTDCLEDADCTSTDAPYCNRGRCQSVPGVECIARNDCDPNQICVRGRCVDPPSFTTCQFQSDCPDGEACYADGRCHAESETCEVCPGQSRCVAERADELGTCAGCTVACDNAACPDGQVCFVSDGDTEGYCVDDDSAPECAQ